MTLDVMYSAASILVLVYFIYQCEIRKEPFFGSFSMVKYNPTNPYYKNNPQLQLLINKNKKG